MMTVKEIYVELEANLSKIEPRMRELEKLVVEYRKTLQDAEEELKTLSNQYEGLRMSKEALELIDAEEENDGKVVLEFDVDAEQDILNEASDKTETKGEAEKTKSPEHRKSQPLKLKWTTKNARLLRIDRNGNVLGNYVTQAAAAREMGWDQSSVSRFMKFSREQQIARKNFYFKWEY